MYVSDQTGQPLTGPGVKPYIPNSRGPRPDGPAPVSNNVSPGGMGMSPPGSPQMPSYQQPNYNMGMNPWLRVPPGAFGGGVNWMNPFGGMGGWGGGYNQPMFPNGGMGNGFGSFGPIGNMPWGMGDTNSHGPAWNKGPQTGGPLPPYSPQGVYSGNTNSSRIGTYGMNNMSYSPMQNYGGAYMSPWGNSGWR